MISFGSLIHTHTHLYLITLLPDLDHKDTVQCYLINVLKLYAVLKSMVFFVLAVVEDVSLGEGFPGVGLWINW